MIPLGPILGVAGIAAATILVPMAVRGYNGMIAEREAARIEVALSRQADEFQDKMRTNADAAKTENEELKAALFVQEKDYLEQINAMSRTIEKQMDDNPFSVDFAIYDSLRLGMCQIAATGNQDAREACRVFSSEAKSSLYSPVISVTRKTIDNWQFLCDETGDAAYCEPRIIGLRPQAAIELIAWIRQVDTMIQIQDSNFDSVKIQIDKILEIPGPTIEE